MYKIKYFKKLDVAAFTTLGKLGNLGLHSSSLEL